MTSMDISIMFAFHLLRSQSREPPISCPWDWLCLQWKLRVRLLSKAHLLDIVVGHVLELRACNKRATAACQPYEPKGNMYSSTNSLYTYSIIT